MTQKMSIEEYCLVVQNRMLQKATTRQASWLLRERGNLHVTNWTVDALLDQILSSMPVFNWRVQISCEYLWSPISQNLNHQSASSNAVQMTGSSPSEGVATVQGRIQAWLWQQTLEPCSEGPVGDEASSTVHKGWWWLRNLYRREKSLHVAEEIQSRVIICWDGDDMEASLVLIRFAKVDIDQHMFAFFINHNIRPLQDTLRIKVTVLGYHIGLPEEAIKSS